MNRAPARFVLALLALVCAGAATNSADAAWVTADRSLRDWGITVNDNKTPSSSYGNGLVNQTTNVTTPTTRTNTYNGFKYYYALEDSNDLSNSYTVGPNTGGQNYDAEFMGMGIKGDQLVIAILTGQRPDNGLETFAPGDIKITTSIGVFGVEVGGSAGTGTFGATVLGDPGSTYQVKTSGSNVGQTIGVLNSNGTYSKPGTTLSSLNSYTSTIGGADSEQKAGSIWFNPTWIKDPIADPTTDVQIKYTGGSPVAMADSFMYTGNTKKLNSVWPNSDSKGDRLHHAIIEVAIPLSVFMDATITGAAWAPSCGNDIMQLKHLQLKTTPEPTSVALMGIGGLATWFAGVRRRRRSLAAA